MPETPSPSSQRSRPLIDAAKSLLPLPVKAALRPAFRAVASSLVASTAEASSDAPGLRPFPFGHYLASEKLGIVLCAIPKCGCSTTKYWFARAILGQDLQLRLGGIHELCRKQFSLEFNHSDLEWSRYFKICIVRDPLDRLASAFRSKFVSRAFNPETMAVIEAVALGPNQAVVHDATRTIRRGGVERILPRSSKVNYRRGITFRQFVQYVSETPSERLNPHWRPQADFLAPVKFDFIAPLEHLGWAIRVAMSRTGLSGPSPETRETRSSKAARTECLADVPAGQLRANRIESGTLSLYDDELRDRVKARYAADLALYAAAERPDEAH